METFTIGYIVCGKFHYLVVQTPCCSLLPNLMLHFREIELVSATYGGRISPLRMGRDFNSKWHHIHILWNVLPWLSTEILMKIFKKAEQLQNQRQLWTVWQLQRNSHQPQQERTWMGTKNCGPSMLASTSKE